MTADEPRQPATISVVLPTWNRGVMVVRAIESVLAQTFVDFELVVVDDGSTDDTVDRIAAIQDPRVRVLTQDHRGVSAARNAGAAASRGAFVTFLDSDDAALPTWLQRMTDALAAPAADVAVCGATVVDPDGGRSSLVPTAAALGPDSVAPRFLAGCAAWRRDLFLDIGGYDGALRFGENTELALRLLTHPNRPRVVAVGDALIVVQQRSTAATDRAAVADSARTVLERYRDRRSSFPRLWAAYHGIVGVDWARRGHPWRARRHFAGAWAARPRSREHAGRLLTSLVPGAIRRVWPAERRGSSVMFVVLAPGIGGSVRSLGTALSHLSGIHRIVARPPGSSTSGFIHDRELADVVVDLPLPTGRRLLDRARAVRCLTGAAFRNRTSLAAIHANGLAELNLVIVPALVAACPIVVWVHEWELSAWSRRLAPVIRLAAPAAQFAAVSDQSRRMIVSGGLAPAARVQVVPNPIDPDDVCSIGTTPPGSSLRVAYVGTPAAYKGFDLLPALVRATTGDPVSWSVFAGPETMMPDVFNELRALGVDLRGKVVDIREAYAACDVVLVPSRHESFGRVVVEAMANGLPVVASDLEPIRDLLGVNEAGLLVPAADVDAFAGAVRRLTGDPGLRRSLGAEGRRRSNQFAPGPVAVSLQRLYGAVPPDVGHVSEVFNVGAVEPVPSVEDEGGVLPD